MTGVQTCALPIYAGGQTRHEGLEFIAGDIEEFFAAGMYRFRETVQEVLSHHFPDCGFYWFAEEHVQKQESFDCRPPEPPEAGVITEHGLRFRVAPGSKHKTGFFLDQRDNRKALADFCSGKRVLA